MPGLPRLRDGGLPQLREGGLPAPLPPFLPRPQDGPDILLISGVWGWWLGPLCFLLAQQSLRGRRVLIIRGKAQVPVSPPAFSLLFLLVLQGPLPGQAGQSGPALPADRHAADRRASRPLRAAPRPARGPGRLPWPLIPGRARAAAQPPRLPPRIGLRLGASRTEPPRSPPRPPGPAP